MSERAQRDDERLNWILIAHAMGMRAAQQHVSFDEASRGLRADAVAAGVPLSEIAEGVIRTARRHRGDPAAPEE